MNGESIEWLAPEHYHTEKGPDWFWAVGIISVSIAALSVIMGNPLFAVLILIAAFNLAMYAKKVPEQILVRIDNTGVTLGKYFYSYGDIKSFWVETRHGNPTLMIRPKRTFSFVQIIPILDTDPQNIQLLLSLNSQEEEMFEPISHKILEYFGF